MKRKNLNMVLLTLAILSIFLASNSYSRIINIGAQDFSFTPQNITNAVVGDTIQWTRINGNHTTTCDGSQFTSRPLGAPPWDAPLDVSNPTFRYVITVAGEYIYKCTPHVFEGMTGVIRTLTPSITQVIEPVESHKLAQNYPNPFNPTTKIRFSIPNSSQVILKIFNSIGQEVATLVNERLNIGSYEVDWNASGFPSNIYYYRINAGEFSQTKKMLLLK